MEYHRQSKRRGLMRSMYEIDKILDPKFLPPAPAAGAARKRTWRIRLRFCDASLWNPRKNF
jgi:hypothetical protein